MTDKKVKPKKEKSKQVQGIDAVIRVNLFLPDMEPEERVIRIKNLKGRATRTNRQVKDLVSAMILGLKRKSNKMNHFELC